MAQAYNHMIMPLANRARQADADSLGPRRFWQPVRTDARRHVAAGDGGRSGNPRSDGASRHCVHGARAASGEAVRPLGGGEWQDVAGGKIDPTRAYLLRTAERGALSTCSSTTGRSRRRSRSRSCWTTARHFARRLTGAFAESPDWAAADAHCDRWRNLRASPSAWRNGAGLCARHDRDQEIGQDHELWRVSRSAPPALGSADF